MRERRAGARGRRSRRRLAVDVRSAPSTSTRPCVVELDARLVEPEPLDVGAAAGGDDEPVDLARLAAVREGARSSSVVWTSSTNVAGVDLDALLLEAALGELGDVGVLGRQDAVEALEEPDLDAQARVRGGDLGARRAGADDGQRRGQLVERPRLLGADDAAAERRARDRPLHRAGGEDDRLAASISCRRSAADLDVAVGGQRAVALDDVDAVLLEQAGDAAGQRLDDLLRGAPITAPKSTVGSATCDAELAGVADLLQHVGRRAGPPWPGCRRSSGSARRPASFSTTAVFMPSWAARIAAT